MGLRSLAPGSAHYAPRYFGALRERETQLQSQNMRFDAATNMDLIDQPLLKIGGSDDDTLYKDVRRRAPYPRHFRLFG